VDGSLTAARLAADPVVAALLTRCRFADPGSHVRLGVSGGPDSTALAVLATAAGLAVTIVHVDHGIRATGAAERAIVAALAGGLGAVFAHHHLAVADGPNLEARLRAARHEVLGADALLGHTADDQAETVLLNLLRGAGLDGLAGMTPERHPILGLRRADTRALVDHLGLEVVEDPSNIDRRFRRNRVRHELLPLLDDLAERDVAAVIARQSELLRADADLLEAMAVGLDASDAKALAGAPLPVARRAVRAWLRESHPPDADTVERVLAVARGEALATDVGGGRRVTRHLQRLRIEPAG
jgi:tRNA(Ile)-lysidine synthase